MMAWKEIYPSLPTQERKKVMHDGYVGSLCNLTSSLVPIKGHELKTPITVSSKSEEKGTLIL